MSFGFSTMPNAAQRYGMTQTPDADLLAAQAQQEASQKGPQKPTPPQGGSGAPSGDGVNIHSSDPFGSQGFGSDGFNMPPASGVSLTPTPWTTGGVNLPGAYGQAADAASAAGGAAGAAGGASAAASPAWMDMLAGVLGL